MYTIMPYRNNREVTRRDSGWFSDPVLDRFFDMGNWFGSSAFRVDLKDKGEELRSWVEDTLNAEGGMVYHVIITFDAADFV